MPYQLRNVSVLIVESSKAMFDLTKSVLSAFGVGTVISAYDISSAFNIFCRDNPDLVIIDWLQDPYNGLELTRKIRNDAQSPNPFAPIIMMTGYSHEKRVFMARDAGITEFLAKPFTAKSLYRRIEQIIENPRQFVKSSTYFGPERRRRSGAGYRGPDRRLNREENSNNDQQGQ